MLDIHATMTLIRLWDGKVAVELDRGITGFPKQRVPALVVAIHMRGSMHSLHGGTDCLEVPCLAANVGLQHAVALLVELLMNQLGYQLGSGVVSFVS